jgi:hypothetical protein
MGNIIHLSSKKYLNPAWRDELWKDPIPRSPPEKEKLQIADTEKSVYDYSFFDNVCV